MVTEAMGCCQFSVDWNYVACISVTGFSSVRPRIHSSGFIVKPWTRIEKIRTPNVRSRI
jgi:hypothetical protein